jgi:hypothetical protein
VKLLLVEDLLFGKPYHEKLVDIISDMVNNVIADDEMLVQQIKEWEISETRNLMLIGERYYMNKTDLRETKVQDMSWKSNLKLEHGFLKKLVDRKQVTYLQKNLRLQLKASVIRKCFKMFLIRRCSRH